MKNKKIAYLSLIFIVILIIFFIFFKKPQNHEGQNKDKLNVQAGWIINGEFANVCSAIVRGYYDEVNLDVKLIPGGPSGANFIVATTAIAQDQSLDIGIDGDIVPLLRGVAKEKENEKLKVKAFASFWTENPYGFMVRKDSGIESIKDFSKRKADGSKIKIGVTADFVLQDAIADYLGVEVKDLNFITVGFDATSLLTQEVDALAGYWTTQAYELEKAGIPYNFLKLSEIPGFEQPSMVAVASDVTILEKKDQLERWLQATKKGVDFVINNPELAAADILDERCGGNKMDLEQETWLIKKSIPLFDEEIPGKLDIKMVDGFAQQYFKIKQIPYLPDINTYVDQSLLK